MLRFPILHLLVFVLLVFAATAAARIYPTGDLNEDHVVDFQDINLFAASWLDPVCATEPGCDADFDGQSGVNGEDFALLAENWLSTGMTLVISEFVASNASSPPLGQGELLDDDEDSSDWIEIYNSTESPINLEGWSLTDDPNELDRWKFPAIELGPGQFLIVFASGKDRAVVNDELHTDFRLDADDPEYLALVEPDGVIAHEYAPQYPEQLTDVSYGLAQYATTFVAEGTSARWRVPEASDIGADWASLSFDDSSWNQGNNGLGFGNASPGFTVTLYQANSTIDNIDAAEAVVANPSSYSSVQSETAPVINYFNSGGTGNFTNDQPFPGTTMGVDADNFAVVATAVVEIPSTGNWTFGVNSDDGFALRLKKGSRVYSTSYPNPRGTADTLAVFDVAEAGSYELRLIFFERSGGSALELFAAKGAYSAFDRRAFRLVGQATSSGLTASTLSNRVATNVEAEMQNVNASIWTRFEFQAEEPDFYDSLSLRMRYEDGFVAYLNGVEIARANFTSEPQYDSKASSNRPNDLAGDFETFDVSPYLVLLREGKNVLAVHGLNDEVDDSAFLALAELTGASSQTVAQYLAEPTPGTFNTSGAPDRVGDTAFSHDRGFYDAPFDVTIETPTEGATIMYTTDGSAPTETHGTQYSQPVRIDTTTCLRAMAYKPGWISTNVDTHTYVFLDDVLRQPANPPGFPSEWDYEMDPEVVNNPAYSGEIKDDFLALPTMSIVTNTAHIFGAGGIYPNWGRSGVAWERPCSVELFYPDNTTGFQVDCGIRIYGGVGRREDKKTFRLLFKRIYGPTKLRYDLFDYAGAVEEFDSIILRAGFNNSWTGVFNQGPQYIRDTWMCNSQLAMGQPGLHGTFVHLYVNGLYWGLYNPVERANADFGSSYFGGDKEEYDALNSYPRNVVDGTADAWIAAQSIAQAGVADQAGLEAMAEYVDIDNLIDYMCLNFYAGNQDWDDHNWYTVRRRLPGAGWKFISWDAERTLESITGHNKTGVGQFNKPSYLYSALRQNPEFRMRFADRAHNLLFNDGALTPDRARARYKELADRIYGPIVCESARWGDNKSSSPRTRNGEWIKERDRLLNNYFPRRTDVAIGFLKGANLYPSVDAPQFMVNGRPQHGGQVYASDQLAIASSFGTIYYTLDGSDPRLPGGEPNPNAEIFVGGGTQRVFVPEHASKRVLVPTAPIGEHWDGSGAFNDSLWIVASGSPGGVGYDNNTTYLPHLGLDIESQMDGRNTTCLIRIPFELTADDLDGISSMTLKIKYDDGFIAYLNGAEMDRRNAIGSKSWNSSSDGQHSDTAAVNFENVDVSDDVPNLRVGTNILAIHGLNVSLTSSDFLISAELVGVIPNEQSTFSLDQSAVIKARARDGSTFSALSHARFSVGPVAESLRISEIMYHPPETGDPLDPNVEYIELTNIGSEPLNLNLVSFTNGVDYTFGPDVLNPDDYVLVVKDIAAFEGRYGAGLNVAGEYEGSLDNGGERIELEDASGRKIHDFSYKDGWYDITDGAGFSLTVINPAAPDPNLWDDKDGWRASAAAGGSPGGDDAGAVPNPGAIVINEVLAHSHAEAPDWIELHNVTDEPVNIGGWYLSDSDFDDANRMKYRIADNTVIDRGGYVVFFEDLHFNNPADPGAIAPFALSENGEEIVLSSASGGVLTGYREKEDFGASPTGIAFGRYYKESTDNFNFVLMSENTPGYENAYPYVGPIVINEIMYNPASGNQNEEYIELLNITSSPVTLYDYSTLTPWQFTDGIEFEFSGDSPVTVPANGFVLLVKDLAAFIGRYGPAPASAQAFVYETGNLSNGGEKVEISMPGDVDSYGNRQFIRIDRVNYSDGSHPEETDPWPTAADGFGLSLSRIVPTDYGNDPANFKAANPTPGLENP